MGTRQKVKTFLEQGKSVKEIAEILNMNPKSLWYHTRHFPKKTIGKGYRLKVNHFFFDEIDSEIKAYLLGYLLADGCVLLEPKKKNGKVYSYSKRISFMVSLDDKYCLDLFKTHVCPDAKIIEKLNTKGAKNRKTSCILRFSSKKIVDTLIDKYKIKPRKTWDTSFVFDFNTIPKDLTRHFIRGYFDGDGWVAGTSINSKNSKIGLIFNSKAFSLQVKDILDSELDCNCNIHKEKTWYNLQVSTYDRSNIQSEKLTKNLLDYLYKESNYFLERKLVKFKFQNKYTDNTEITDKIKKLSVL